MTFELIEIFFITSHMLFSFFLYKKFNFAFSVFHPLQISFLFVLVTAYLPLKFDFVFQHSYLLFEIPLDYFFEVFRHYVFAQVIIYILIFIFYNPSHALIKTKEINSNLYISTSVLLSVSLIPAVFLIIKFNNDLINLDVGQFSFNVKNDGNFWLLIVTVMVAIIPSYYLFKKRIIDNNFWLISIFSLFLLIIFGSRMVVIVYAISTIYTLIFFMNLDIRKTIPFFLVVFIFFILISFFRSNSALYEDQFIFFAAYLIRNNDFLYNSALPLYMHDIGYYNFFMGKTWIVDALKIFQPSFIFDKELSYFPSRFFYGSYASVDARTFNFGFFGRAYMEFGLVGFYLMFIIFNSFYHYLLVNFYTKNFDYLSTYMLSVLFFVRYPVFLLIGMNSHIISLIIVDCLYFLLPNMLIRKWK